MGKFDGIFDDVVVNAKAAASAVSKKATDVYGTSKMKIAAAEIRNEIRKKLRDLGALTYKLQKGIIANADNEIAELVNDISELKDSLDTINKNLASAKNQKKCPECNANVPKNSVFCNICGAKLKDEEPVEEEAAQAYTEVQTDTEAVTDTEENTDTFVDAEDEADTIGI